MLGPAWAYIVEELHGRCRRHGWIDAGRWRVERPPRRLRLRCTPGLACGLWLPRRAPARPAARA